MNSREAIAAIYNTHTDAEQAIMALRHKGFDLSNLSIAGKVYHTNQLVGTERINRGKMGAFWGGLWGLLLGAAFFAIPDFGPMLIAGPLVRSVIVEMDGEVLPSGLSVLGAGLSSFGLPHDSIIKYEKAIHADKFLVVAHGIPAELARVRSTIDGSIMFEAAMRHASSVRSCCS